MAQKSYHYALGRRKSSTARVRVSAGTGKIVINGEPASEYLENSQSLLFKLESPLRTAENFKVDISAKVLGGGKNGQVEAVAQGISKALVLMNEDLKGTLKRAGLLGRDPREKERKKFGLKGARKKRQFTKR